MTSRPPAADHEPVTPSEARTGMGPEWRVLDGAVSAWFEAPSLRVGAALVGRIAGSSRHLPDVDLRPSGLRIRVCLPQPGAARAETAVAREISSAARELGLVADPTVLQTVDLAIDTADSVPVIDFWSAATSYEPGAEHELLDPARRDPALRFQLREQVPPLRSRFHVDVVRPPELVGAVRAAVGQDPFGVYGLTLADVEGNEVDQVPGDRLGEGSGTADWRIVFAAMAHYPTASAAQITSLVTAVADLADQAGVSLLIDIRADGVTLHSGKDLWEDEVQPAGVHFVELAARIQSAAHDLGLAADPNRARFIQFGIDAVDVPVAREFWATVLDYRLDQREGVTDIFDPRRLNPEIIFQDLDASDEARRRQRDRIRLGLWVADDLVQARVDTAVAAGGRVVADDRPGRCTLSDPEGNELVLRWG